MVSVVIGRDGACTPRTIVLGNKYENEDEYIQFDLPEEFNNHYNYLIGVIETEDAGTVYKIFPIFSNQIIVSVDLTSYEGKWSLYVMCREHELDLSGTDVDITAKTDEHVFISDGFYGLVRDNLLKKSELENITLDSNLQIVYDDLLVLKAELEAIIEGGISATFTWDNLAGKPDTFPPSAHNHNELYYTKTEVDSQVPEVVAEKVIPKIAEEVIPEVVPEVVSDIAITPDDAISNEEIESLFNVQMRKLLMRRS